MASLWPQGPSAKNRLNVVGKERVGPERGEGFEQTGEELNHSRAELVLAMALTTTDRAQRLHWAIDPPEGGLRRRSFAMPEMTRAISHRRLLQRFGEVEAATLIELCHRLHLLTRPPTREAR